MFDVLSVLAAVLAGKEIIKEKMTPTIPAEYWKDKRRIERDSMILSNDEFMKRLAAGEYKEIITVKTEDVLPDKSKSWVIEDMQRFLNDREKYDSVQVMIWRNEGRYRWV